MKMKKIILASSVVAAAGVSMHADATTIGTAPIAQAACALLNSDASVKITLSTGNIGSYDCNTSTANIGVAVASTTGKNKVFSLSSSGGQITTGTTGTSAPTTADTEAAATTASATS